MSESNPTNGKVWVKKTMNSMPFSVGGKRVPFEGLAGNIGVIGLDTEKDRETIAAIQLAVSQKRGGMVVINEETYLELKKKQVLTRSVQSSGRSPIRIFNPDRMVKKLDARNQSQPVAAAVEDKTTIVKHSGPGNIATARVIQDEPPPMSLSKEAAAIKPATAKLDELKVPKAIVEQKRE